MKKIMLIGSEGSIGRRYKAVLKYLGAEVLTYDPAFHGNEVPTLILSECDGFVVAAPTVSHVSWCYHLLDYKKPILCEKPLGANVHEVEELSKYAGANEFISVVNNWEYILQVKGRCDFNLKYQNYYTGGEKLAFNLAQGIYLTSKGGKLEIERHPFFILRDLVREKAFDSADVDHSYLQMMGDWLTYKTTTWKVSHALEMQLAIEKFEQQQKENK